MKKRNSRYHAEAIRQKTFGANWRERVEPKDGVVGPIPPELLPILDNVTDFAVLWKTYPTLQDALRAARTSRQDRMWQRCINTVLAAPAGREAAAFDRWTTLHPDVDELTLFALTLAVADLIAIYSDPTKFLNLDAPRRWPHAFAAGWTLHPTASTVDYRCGGCGAVGPHDGRRHAVTHADGCRLAQFEAEAAQRHREQSVVALGRSFDMWGAAALLNASNRAFFEELDQGERERIVMKYLMRREPMPATTGRPKGSKSKLTTADRDAVGRAARATRLSAMTATEARSALAKLGIECASDIELRFQCQKLAAKWKPSGLTEARWLEMHNIVSSAAHGMGRGKLRGGEIEDVISDATVKLSVRRLAGKNAAQRAAYYRKAVQNCINSKLRTLGRP